MPVELESLPINSKPALHTKFFILRCSPWLRCVGYVSGRVICCILLASPGAIFPCFGILYLSTGPFVSCSIVKIFPTPRSHVAMRDDPSCSELHIQSSKFSIHRHLVYVATANGGRSRGVISQRISFNLTSGF